MPVNIVCVTPDHLSTLIFCKTLSRMIGKMKGMQLITMSGPVESVSEDIYREDLYKDVQAVHINIPMKRFIAPLSDILYFLRLYRGMKRVRCSVVITFATKPNIYGQWAAFLAGVPVRVMAVRGLGRAFSAESRKKRILPALMTALYCFSCKVANVVWFTNRHDLADFLLKKIVVKRKIFLTKNAIDLKDFCSENIHSDKVRILRDELNLQRDQMVVIMVARLLKEKGILEFCEAAVLLKDRVPNLRFLLVAPVEPPSPSSVPVEYLRRMESRANLLWLGFRKDVRELYAISDLAVLPSYYKEGGYPRALLEAMAYGKPVIAADVPECRGPVENGLNGYLVPPKNAKALAEAIEKVVTNLNLRIRMGEHSLLRVQKEFNDQVVFRKLVEEVLLPQLGKRGIFLNQG